MDHEDDRVIAKAEETARIETRPVRTGLVRIETRVDIREEILRADLTGDVVDVVRVPVDREIAAMPAIRTEGDLTIVPVVEEVLHVEKRLVLKEELHIRRRTTTEAVAVPVTLRRQEAIVEREGVRDGDHDQEKMT